jgi:putative ABC transport system permease protein
MQNYQYFKRAAETLESSYMSGKSMADESESSGSLTPQEQQMQAFFEKSYFLYGDTALRSVGGKDKVNSIKIYTDNFDNKELILNYLDEWNETHDAAKEVQYTDTIGMMLTMVETILNAITYVLVAFTAISLVVSSVMIGIITYVSVVERTKEIGVLRSLGARKKDVKHLFNAETFIIGLASGLFGVMITYALQFAINSILSSLTGIGTLASLPIRSAVIMVCVSIILTLISGLIPARAAAKKDPVLALRTE